MPPWEVINVLLGVLATDGIPRLSQSEDDVNQDDSMTDSCDDFMLGIYDISRVHFISKTERELYTEIPKEDLCDGDGDGIGKLNRNMYGIRDAANGWFRDWQSLLASKGYKTGVANPALFHNPHCGARGGVYGDDFYVLATSKDHGEMNELLASTYSVRETHRLGFGRGCVQEATVLNRVVQLGIENGRTYVQIEPDSRHVQFILKILGLSSKSGSTAVPGVKVVGVELGRRLSEPQLSNIEISAFRSC